MQCYGLEETVKAAEIVGALESSHRRPLGRSGFDLVRVLGMKLTTLHAEVDFSSASCLICA